MIRHAVGDLAYCDGCKKKHGPLFMCKHYDAEDREEVRRLNASYSKLYYEGKAGLLGVFFPPVEMPPE